MELYLFEDSFNNKKTEGATIAFFLFHFLPPRSFYFSFPFLLLTVCFSSLSIAPKKTHLLAPFHLNGYKVRLVRFQNYYFNFCAFILSSV